MTDFSFKKFLTRFYTKSFVEEDLMSSAAQVAFYFAFALFPLLLFFLSLFGLVLESANDLRTEMFYYLRQVMPLSAFELVKTTIEEVTENSSGGKLTVGILIAIWSASAGIDGVRVALNGVYNLSDERPYWKTKLIALLMTFGLGILITIALGSVFYGSKFTLLILSWISLPIQSPFVLGILQWVIILAVLVTIFAIIYNFLPQHKKHHWVWISPGTIAGIVLWLLLSYSFRLYLEYFNTYAKTYGSLGAMIILMLWLYLTALVILIGGAINAVLQEFSDPETAQAGANKAAAKEIVENPDKSIENVSTDADKLLEGVPNAENQNKARDEESLVSVKPSKIAGEPRAAAPTVISVQKTGELSKKPVISLLVGSVFGVLFGLIYSKKNRDN
jgi:membrane protein